MKNPTRWPRREPTYRYVVRYLAVDGYSSTRRFMTLEGARSYARQMVGEHPTTGGWYAVSDDGVGRVTVEGATLAEIFPPRPEPKCPSVIPSGMYWDEDAGRLEFNPNESGYIAMQGDPMAIYEDYPDEPDQDGPIGDMVALLWTPVLPPEMDDCPF